MFRLSLIFISSFLFSFTSFAADQITSGMAHSCHLDESKNQVTCWGWNHHGQLGQGNDIDAAGAKPIKLPAGKVKQVEAGGGSSCAIVDKDLYCWGDNGHGQLGLSDYVSRPYPTKVPLPGPVTQVSMGFYHTCALVNGGALCWGFNFGCQVGQEGCKGGKDNPRSFIYKPLWVMDLGPGSGVTHVEAGESTSCAIRNKGLYCWGSALLGLLGDGNRKIEYRPKPQVVPGHGEGSGVREVSIGHLHSCVNRNGLVRCWGVADFLGIDDGHKVLTPTVPKNVLGNPWPNVTTFDGTTCVTRKGQAYCWGDAAFGALGTGKDELYGHIPHKVAKLNKITAMATGRGHTCAINDGKVYCWGWNNFCQVGVGTCGDKELSVLAPKPVLGL